MQEFDELALNKLIEEALLGKEDSSHPFASSYIGLGESDILSFLHEKFSKKIIESEVSEIFYEMRDHFLSRRNSLTLQDLHTVTKNCDKCKLNSTPELPKWNVQNPLIAIVVESPSIPQESISLLVDAAKNAGLASSDLCLTYVNRCPIRRKFENQEIINCSPYLHSELQFLNPKLIITLGGLASSVLFGTEIKMKDYRGSISWLGYWPVLPIFSPSYAIKSGESSLQIFYKDFIQAADFVKVKK
jgi:uracil-DNA glycosylase family 4